jgi:tetratricopeptide (TPR) repeat protein
MNLLELGLKAHQSGNLPVAENMYLQQIKLFPKDPNAKQLLGALYLAQGKTDAAILLMHESLDLNPNQPHVANNLAICHKKSGNMASAIKFFEQAIAHKVDYFDAYKNLVTVLITERKYYRAGQLLDVALKLWPKNETMTERLATLKKHLGEYPASLSLFSYLVDSYPLKLQYRHNLALVLRLAGKSKEALVHFLILHEQGLKTYELAHNTANAYSDLGELQKAVDFYKLAIKINPDYVESHQNLNNLLWELNKLDDFLISYLESFKIVGKYNELLRYSYVGALLRISKYAEAKDFLLKMPAEYFVQSNYLDLLAKASFGLGSVDEALSIQKRMIELADIEEEHKLNYAKNLLEADFCEIAEVHLKQVLKQNPSDQQALAYLGTSMRMKSSPKEALLNNYDELVRGYVLDAPQGFASTEEFCAELSSYLGDLHTGIRSPLDQTLQGGTQTRGNLFNDENPLIQSLIAQIRPKIADYVEQTMGLTGEEFGFRELVEYDFAGSWSVRLSSQGFHTSHVHPMGRISSVFYVALPPLEETNSEKQGWLKFGEPNLHLKTSLKASHFVRPLVGKLVLFPSYMWHGTVPFNSTGMRTTIAFDIANKGRF